MSGFPKAALPITGIFGPVGGPQDQVKIGVLSTGTGGVQMLNGGAALDDANSTGNLIRLLAPNQSTGLTINNNGMNLVGGVKRTQVAKAGSYTLVAGTDDCVIFTIGAAATATLPTAVGNTGTHFTIINASASTSALTVASNGGSVPAASVAAGAALEVVSDGTNWQAA